MHIISQPFEFNDKTKETVRKKVQEERNKKLFVIIRYGFILKFKVLKKEMKIEKKIELYKSKHIFVALKKFN